jgi:lysophospholipase L1-like esterase
MKLHYLLGTFILKTLLLTFLAIFLSFSLIGQNIAQKKVSNKATKSKKITQIKTKKKSKNITKKTIENPKPLINSALNYIQHPQYLKSFYTALRELSNDKDKSKTNKKGNQRKKVTILHIGDSHIQAGFLTDKMRELLQNKYGNGGRGLIFPYKTIHSTQPNNILVASTGLWQGYSSVRTNVFSRWGISGFTAITQDEKATITLQPSYKKPENITKIKIFYPLFDKTSFDLKILATHKEIKSSRIDENGYVEYLFHVPQKLVSLYFKQQHIEQKQFILQGLTWENDNRGIIYHTAGVNGADVESFLRCADFQKQITALNPDLVIISLGANDILVPNFKPDLFKINYKILLQQIKNAVPKASILVTSPNISCNFEKQPNPHSDLLVTALSELAKKESLAFWDFYTLSGKKENIATWTKENLLTNDKIHLFRKGYELQAQELFKVLVK